MNWVFYHEAIVAVRKQEVEASRFHIITMVSASKPPAKTSIFIYLFICVPAFIAESNKFVQSIFFYYSFLFVLSSDFS